MFCSADSRDSTMPDTPPEPSVVNAANPSSYPSVSVAPPVGHINKPSTGVNTAGVYQVLQFSPCTFISLLPSSAPNSSSAPDV